MPQEEARVSLGEPPDLFLRDLEGAKLLRAEAEGMGTFAPAMAIRSDDVREPAGDELDGGRPRLVAVAAHERTRVDLQQRAGCELVLEQAQTALAESGRPFGMGISSPYPRERTCRHAARNAGSTPLKGTSSSTHRAPMG